MSMIKAGILFFIFLIVLVLIKLPVSLIAERLELPKGIAYEQMSGTVWQGKIKRLQVEGEVLNKVEWDVSPLKLFMAQVEVKFKFGPVRDASQYSGKGTISYSMSGLKVTRSVIRLPASSLKKYSPIPIANVGGRVILDIMDYQYSSALCDTLAGELVWSKSEIDFGGPIAFGTISANLACEEHNISVTFNGLNRLGLEGQALIESTSKFGFDGYLKPDATLPKAVHNGLSMFGKPDVKGKYKIVL